jgi:hypothetical protein
VLDPPEALILDGGDRLPIAELRSRHISVIRVEPSDNHLPT